MSNGEYLPPPQSEIQKRVEQRICELSAINGKPLGLSRRQFMRTSCGMAAAFLAMKEIYGLRALGDADSMTKPLIFGGNAARLYRLNLKAADNTPMPAYSDDRLAALKSQYELAAKEPTNLRYGYVRAG